MAKKKRKLVLTPVKQACCTIMYNHRDLPGGCQPLRAVQKVVISVLTFSFVCLPFAEATENKNLESTFRHLYEGSLLSLRTPYFGKTLEFNSSGLLLNHLVAGPWSTCGLLRVEKLRVNEHGVEIDGKRVILALRSGEKDRQEATSGKLQVVPILTTRDVRIRVQMSPENQDQINNSLAQIFQGGQLLDRVSGYWKPTISEVSDVKGCWQRTPGAVVGELEGNRRVYCGGPGFVPPKAIESPDPEYTPAARHQRLEGTAVISVVVNEKGFPEMLEIVRGLGEGLDIEALVTVARWRFEPALKDGKAVAILVNVEVTFRLG
jgi:TonB family protein